jgi:hypothetical protein
MSFMSPPVPEPVLALAPMPLWLLPVEPVGPMLEPPRLRLDEPVEPPVELLLPLAVEPLALSAPIEPALCEDDGDEPALLLPPTAPVLDAVAPPVLEPVEPVLEPVEPVWSLPWFSWLLLFRLPELFELLPWLPALLPVLLPALLPFPSLDF